MKTMFSPYVEPRKLSTAELKTLLREMEGAMEDFIAEEGVDRSLIPRDQKGRLISNRALANATGYTPERVTGYRTGNHQPPLYFSCTVQLLHRTVTDDPGRAVHCLTEWTKEEKD